MAKDFILTLYSRPETVFTMRELALLFPHISYNNIKSKAHYFASKKKLIQVRNGVYAKEGYNSLELGKIYAPSYISLQTVLQKEGIIFQHERAIYNVSSVSRTIHVDTHTLVYKKMNERILLDKSGVTDSDGYAIASKERAFLDAVFLYRDYHFDALHFLDWKLAYEFMPLYHNNALIKRVKSYYKAFNEEAHVGQSTPHNNTG